MLNQYNFLKYKKKEKKNFKQFHSSYAEMINNLLQLIALTWKSSKTAVHKHDSVLTEEKDFCSQIIIRVPHNKLIH